MKTLGQKMIDILDEEEIRIPLTNDRSNGSWLWRGDDKDSILVHHDQPGFGGGTTRKVRIMKPLLADCNDLDSLTNLLKPTINHTPGDPMNYTPWDVREVEVVIPDCIELEVA